MSKQVRLLGVMLFCIATIFIQAVQAKEPLNIILIMTDDQGWFDAGFNGNTVIKTPHLDALAQQGIIFDRFYSASAVCSPTRASVMTGRNPNRMGIPTANSGHLKIEEITIAELLKEKGYATGHFGKWHLGTLTRKEKDANRGGQKKFEKHFSIPSMHGYDTFFCTESKVPTYDPMIHPTKFKAGESKKYGWTAVEKGEETKPYKTYYWIDEEVKETKNLSGDNTKVMMDRVIPFIDQSVKQKKPFFITLWPHTPHLPVVANHEYKAMYKDLSNKEQLYYGCITALDKQIGRLWQELERVGMSENTMIWYCSDNGPENGTPGSAGSFRERKRSLHEGGLRTPAFVVWKELFKGGQRVDIPAFTSDYLPTIIKLLDVDYPDDRPLDGIDLMPYLLNSQKTREKTMGFQYKNKISWVSHQYKLISKDAGKTYELYDLLDDREEKRDIIKLHPELAQQMQKELEAWLASVAKSNHGEDY